MNFKHVYRIAIIMNNLFEYYNCFLVSSDILLNDKYSLLIFTCSEIILTANISYRKIKTPKHIRIQSSNFSFLLWSIQRDLLLVWFFFKRASEFGNENFRITQKRICFWHLRYKRYFQIMMLLCKYLKKILLI